MYTSKQSVNHFIAFKQEVQTNVYCKDKGCQLV